MHKGLRRKMKKVKGNRRKKVGKGKREKREGKRKKEEKRELIFYKLILETKQNLFWKKNMIIFPPKGIGKREIEDR